MSLSEAPSRIRRVGLLGRIATDLGQHLCHQVERRSVAADGQPDSAQPLSQHPRAPPEELLEEPLVR